MMCTYWNSILLNILFACMYIDICKGKGGRESEYNNIPGGNAEDGDGSNYDLDGMQEFTDNMKEFGMPKIKNNEDVLHSIARIIMRYDLIAVSEVMNRKEKAMTLLMEAINRTSRHPYHYIMSPRVGPAKNKEQYAIIYRPQKIRVKNHTLYEDPHGDNDVFMRQPFLSQISFKGQAEVVALVVVHVKSTAAVKEINALVEVHDWIENHWNIKDVIIIGDLNADCSYVKEKDWSTINLRNQERFMWVIGDEVDTTVTGNTNCAYDRIVISGEYLRNSVISKTGRSYKFDRIFKLDETKALKISDHYPVEFALRYNETAKSTTNSGGMGFVQKSPFLYPITILGSISIIIWKNSSL